MITYNNGTMSSSLMIKLLAKLQEVLNTMLKPALMLNSSRMLLITPKKP